MDDEENKESNNYEDEQDRQMQKVKAQAQKTAHKVKKEADKVRRQVWKKFIEFLIESGALPYVAIAVVIILIIIIIIVAAAFMYLHIKDSLFPTDSEDPKYSEYCPQAYFENVYVTDEGTMMAATSVEDMWKNDKRYRKYLSSVDSLAYLLNAQVVSQSPYIESAEGNDLNGTIKFYRNDSEIPMKFVPQDTFDGYVSSANENGDQDARNNALNSFTINSNGTIKIAYQYGMTEKATSDYEEKANQAAESMGARTTANKTSDGNYTYIVSNNNSKIYTKNISYRNTIQNYSVPFELLWAIVVMADNGSSGAGNSEDFAHALASMAYDGEIEIIIDDNVSSIVTEETESFDMVTEQAYVQINLSRNGNHIDSGDEVVVSRESDKKHYVYEKKEITSEPKLRIKKIESWCAVYESRDSFSTSQMNLPGEVDKVDGKDEKWTVISSDEYSMSYYDCDIDKITNQFSIQENDTNEYWLDYKFQKRTRKENENHIISSNKTTTTSSNATSVTPGYNDELTDLFKVTPFTVVKRYLTKSNYKSFINVLERNSTTANMVDLINYIFNQVTGTENYGKDLDFESIWKASGFISATDSGASLTGDTIQERVWMAFKSAGYSDYATAGVMGNIEQESTFNPNVSNFTAERDAGFGLVQWYMATVKQNLLAYAEQKGDSVESEEIQINFLLAQLDETGQLEACKWAKPEQVTSFDRIQSKGSRACYDGWKNATNVEDATYAFCWFFEGPGDGEANMENRYKAANKYYNDFHGRKVGSSGNGTDESSDTLGIKGYHTSSITGRKFTLYIQDVPGTPWYSVDGCFHCSLGTILSGFGYNQGPNTLWGFSYGSGCYGNRDDFSSKAGCKYATVYGANSNDIKRYLQNGEVIFFNVQGGTVTTDNGSANYSMHWLALLDYKNENGTDKVYVHDPWGGNPSRGWGNLSTIASVIVEYVHVWK